MAKTKRKINKITILYYCIAFVLMVVLRNSHTFTNQAFSYGLYYALVFTSFNLWIVSGLFIVSGMAFGTNLFIVTVIQCAIVIFMRLLSSKVGSKYGNLIIWLTLIMSQIYPLVDGETYLLTTRIIIAIASIIFSFVCVSVLRAVIVRGLRYKLNTDEVICVGVFVATIYMGLIEINLLGISLLLITVPIVLMMCLRLYGSGACFSFAAAIGLSYIFKGLSPNFLVATILYALAATSFSSLSYRISAASIILMDICCGFFLKLYPDYSILQLVAISISAIIYIAIPSGKLNKIADKYGVNNNRYSSRHIINRQRTNLSRKLYELSDVFYEMFIAFKSMVVGIIPVEQAKTDLARNVSQQVCHNCIEKNRCWRADLAETEKTFINLVGTALDRGRVTLLDLNSALNNRCGRVPSLIGAVNQAVANYKQYYTVTTNIDNSRLLIGEQLNGVSQIMRNLSQQSKIQLTYDTEREKQLIEELTYNNILVKEALIFSEGEILFITVVVASNSNTSAVCSAASRVCNMKLMVEQIEDTSNPNWVVLYLRKSPNYDVSFGFSMNKKSDSAVSGDTHSFTKIDSDKLILALCDGMGSGVDAEKASATAISLVENFYKAGFDNQLILTSVNRLLAIRNEETYTAIDICVIDLSNGVSDFIKIGAPCGFVKNNNEIQVINSGSLPLGVLEEMNPLITRKALLANDFILMCSDGLIDAYPDKETLGAVFSQCKQNNPQLIADYLLEKALEYCNNSAKDDMTAIVARIYALE